MSSAFYYPDRLLYATPAQQGLRFEAVEFSSVDGTRLTGWFIPAAGYADPRRARGTVIHFHGNAQNMSAHWRYVEWFPAQGYNVFVFDYRGYGASQGVPEPRGVFEDANRALDTVRVRADVDPQRLLVFGQSLGGANAIAVVGAGNRAGVKAIAIEGSFYSYASIASEKLAGAGAFIDDTYSAANVVGKLAPIPLLLLHGTADLVVPYAHSVSLLDRAQAPKRLVLIDGGGHVEALLSPPGSAKYRQMLLDFFAAALPAPAGVKHDE